jgi:hypothetical protein
MASVQLPETSDPKKRSLKERILSYFKKPPSTTATVVIAVLAIFIAGGAATVASILIKPLTTATSDLPNSALIAGGIGVALGLLLAWIGTVVYYRLRTRVTKLELTATRKELNDRESDTETLRRVEIYADNIYVMLEAFVAKAQSLHDLSSVDTQRAMCEFPEDYLSRATGNRFRLSVLAEPVYDEPSRLRRAAGRVRDTIPDKVSEPVASAMPKGPRFEILIGKLSTDEREAFAVRVISSWLKHHQSQEDDEAELFEESPESDHSRRRSNYLERFVYSADAPYDKLTNADIKAFKRFRYAAVRAISFRRGAQICYLVALSKEENAFTEAEDLYLLWLKRVLELDSVMHNAQSLGGPEDDDDS